MTQEEKREAMERENIEGTAGMTGQDGIDEAQGDGFSEGQKEAGETMEEEDLTQKEAEAAVAWIAEDAQLDAELEALMKEDTSGKKKKKKKKAEKAARFGKEGKAGRKKFFNWKAWSRKRKILTVGAVALAAVAAFNVFGG